ncbi:CRISPR-associated protein Cas4 [Candidatus Woesearchaeota archaeon]|nr:CRISPR-associated protein Cas4 [Candidatus Woesearchaeota archaeon]
MSENYLEQYLRELIDTAKEYLAEKKPGEFWVSDLISCPHKYIMAQKYPEILLGHTLDNNLVLGDIIHTGFESFLAGRGFMIEVEKEVKIGNNTIKGRIDALSEDGLRVIEIKSGKDVKNPPSPHHVLQVYIYMAMTGAVIGKIVYLTYGRLVEVEITKDHILEALRQIGAPRNLSQPNTEWLKEYVEWWTNRAPKPLWPWECDYCPFASLCPYRKSNGNRR